jgi:alpha-glucosidase (family GH31 glycosyl hydrolase)
MLDLVTEYTSYAGRMLPLPDWVSDGLIAGIQGGRDTIREILSRLQSHNVPTTAVLIQDWTGKRIQEVSKSTTLTRQWWNWESDDALYPDWDNFVNEINTNNGKEKIRVMAYVNPFLTNVSIKPQFKRNLFPEAQSKGYMVKGLQTVSPESGGNAFSIRLGPGLEAGLLDLTNPEARNWYKDILKEQVWKSGISGKVIKSQGSIVYLFVYLFILKKKRFDG